MMYGVLVVLQAAGFSFAVTFAVLNWWEWRRYQRLNLVLADIAVRSFMLSHLPLWQVWSDWSGCTFRMIALPRSAPKLGAGLGANPGKIDQNPEKPQ